MYKTRAGSDLQHEVRYKCTFHPATALGGARWGSLRLAPMKMIVRRQFKCPSCASIRVGSWTVTLLLVVYLLVKGDIVIQLSYQPE